jgi:hypothetical protein
MTARRTALGAAFALATIAVALVATGGFVATIGDMRVSARSPAAAAVTALTAAAAWLMMAVRARAVRADLTAAEVWLARRSHAIVLIVAGLAAAVAVHHQTFSAAGADASGYLSQAAMLAEGRLTRHEPLGAIANWPDPGPTLVPLGWRATADPSTQVPTYAVGLPLLMAPLHAVGGPLLASLIGPLALALAVWAAARLAQAVAGPPAAILASIWLATSPVALVAAVQPMSDMPATAAWLLCLALVVMVTARTAPSLWPSCVAGCAAAVAVLIRPNIAPVAAIPMLMLLASRRRAAAAAFAAPVLIGGAIVAFVQWRWFGSPLRSGYGTAAEIYAPSNVAPNARLYAGWLIDTHGPWLLAAPFAVAVAAGRTVWWLLAFAAAIVAAYLVYAVFEVWTYLRFLLPALALAMVCVSAATAALLARVPAPVRLVAVAGVALTVGAMQIRSARSHDVFDTADRHARAALAGRYLASALPERSIVIAGEQSGAVRYYTGRSILRWEAMTPAVLAAASARAADAGYEVWIALDEWEEDLVRRKFSSIDAGRLDWPPLLEAGTLMRTRAWRLRDREAFLRDGSAHTDLVR